MQTFEQIAVERSAIIDGFGGEAGMDAFVERRVNDGEVVLLAAIGPSQVHMFQRDIRLHLETIISVEMLNDLGGSGTFLFRVVVPSDAREAIAKFTNFGDASFRYAA